MIDLNSLAAQIEDCLILEDEVELARLAVLVPEMVETLSIVVAVLHDASAVLLRVQATMDEIGCFVGEERISVDANRTTVGDLPEQEIK